MRPLNLMASMPVLLAVALAGCGDQTTAPAPTTDAILPVANAGTNAAAATVSVFDLGPLTGGTYSFAYDINNQGVIVGQGNDPTRYPVPIVWRTRIPVKLPTVGGLSGRAYALNDLGDIVGTTWDQLSFNFATLWRGGGAATNLGALPIAAAPRSHAMAINGRGDIIGASNELVDPTTGILSLVRWPAGGAMADLGPIDRYLLAAYFPQPSGINDSGVIVGIRGGTGAPVLVYPPRAFMWRNGSFVDLPSLGGSFAGTAANAINSAGVIAGSSRTATGTSGFLHAVVWKNGVPTDLGVLSHAVGADESVAYAIADNGDVAGYSIAANYQPHAVLWRSGQIIDLGVSPGGLSSKAWGINDNGQVVGEGVVNTTTFDTHALLWTVTAGGGNTAPSVTLAATSPTTIRVGGRVNMQGSFTDPDNGPWSYLFRWGNGPTSGTLAAPGTITATRTYTRAGTFSVRLIVTDARGAAATSNSVTVRVN